MRSINGIETMFRMPKTRYPFNVERSYANNINKLNSELSDLVVYEFDNIVGPLIVAHRMVTDSQRNDSIMDNLRNAILKIKVLALGAFQNLYAKRVANKFVKGVSATNKTNVNSQLKVKGINPIETEPWLKPFLEAKVQENVSYITSIRDNYADKVEQIILRGVTGGRSTTEMREEILKHSELSVNKATFIARDQTGTLLGQMNAERHQRAGFIAFRWSDSGDNRVRHSHAERNGKIYFYADNPLLPGEDYGCRCVAEMVDEFDADYLSELQFRKNNKVEGHQMNNLGNNGIINIEVDKFTPCLEDAKTGEILDTVVKDISFTNLEAKDLNRQGWNFDWNDLNGSSKVKAIYLEGSNTLQGLISFYENEDHVFVEIVESAPHNVGENKRYYGVAGHLFALASEYSLEHNFDGYVVFTPKTALVEHYINSLGAQQLPNGNLVLTTAESIKLIKKYGKD